MKSIYDELGGEEVLEKAIVRFTERLCDDPLLQLYFVDVDMPRIRDGLKRYLVALLGGPGAYRGRTLFEAHRGTQITDLAFDSFVDLFIATLKEMGLKDEMLAKVKQKLAPLKNDVVDSFHWTGKHFYAPERRGE